MIHARITGTGSYAPKKIITNHDLGKLVDTSDEWIIERTGIKERRIAEKGQTTSDLAYEASRKALKAAGLGADEVDLILVATMTPDMILPSLGCVLQEKLVQFASDAGYASVATVRPSNAGSAINAES